jgi:hypothetical protein
MTQLLALRQENGGKVSRKEEAGCEANSLKRDWLLERPLKLLEHRNVPREGE